MWHIFASRAVDTSHMCRFLASGDRDGKLRVSELPEEPAKGSWSILSYCLGHSGAVMCCAICKLGRDGAEDQHVLVSGGLEGLVIVWNWRTGEQRCSLRLSQSAGVSDMEGEGLPRSSLRYYHPFVCRCDL